MPQIEELVAVTSDWEDLGRRAVNGQAAYGLIGVARGRDRVRYLLAKAAETGESHADMLMHCTHENMGLIEFYAACDTAEATARLAELAVAAAITPLLVAAARPAPAIWRWEAQRSVAIVENLRLLSSNRNVPCPIESQMLGTAMPPPSRLDRQIAALGEDGLRKIRTLTVALIGCGGTGGLLAQLLALAGVGRIILIDHDRIEQNNRNRLVAASDTDVRRRSLKVVALQRYLSRLAPDVAVIALPLSLYDPHSLSAIVAADVLVGCTDNEGSRLHMNRLAIQYLLPYVDCGVGIVHGPHELVAGGQIRTVLPGGPCLECYEGIDRWLAAADLTAPSERARRHAQGYGLDTDAPAPSLAPLNAAIAAEAATAVVALATGLRPAVTFLAYDMLAARMGPRADMYRNPDCAACGLRRVGRGDSLPLPRPDQDQGSARVRKWIVDKR